MVKAWMEGRKSVTRRIVKLPPDFHPVYAASANMEDPPVWFDFVDEGGMLRRTKAPYRSGETVYIKEAWAYHDPLFDDDKAEAFHVAALIDPSRIIYRASSPEYLKRRWRSPRFMPEWASRSKARIVSVRPERVQEINDEDAFREGCNGPIPACVAGEMCEVGPCSYVHDFRSIWDTLHPGSWGRNDFVWRVELEKI
jgi:hypothetical protein